MSKFSQITHHIKTMKKRTMLGIAFGVLIGIPVIYDIGHRLLNPESFKAQQEEIKADQEEKEAKEKAEKQAKAKALVSWENFTFKDEWGNPTNTGAKSALTSPSRVPDRPYQDLRAALYVDGCEHAWVRFTGRPNLTGGDPFQGNDFFSIKARAAGEDVTEKMLSGWGSKDLYYREGQAEVIKGWASGQTYEILMPLFVGSVSWNFNMTGAMDAIAKTCPSVKQ